MQEEIGREIAINRHIDPPSPNAMPKSAADSRTARRVASTSRRDMGRRRRSWRVGISSLSMPPSGCRQEGNGGNVWLREGGSDDSLTL